MRQPKSCRSEELGSWDGDTSSIVGVLSSVGLKLVAGDRLSMLSMDPGVRLEKLTGVTGRLKLRDSVGERAWRKVGDDAGVSHSVVRLQEYCGDWGGIQVRGG